jgi:outer membrane protein OmpA-like peptidoglycan-associated protein
MKANMKGALALAALLSGVAAGPAAAQDWQGFYIGAHTGYTWGEADQPYGDVGGPYDSTDQDAPDVSGWIYGVQGGYNFELGGNWLLGLELQGTWGDREGDDGGTGGDVNGVEINSEYSIRARGGYLFGPETLIYLTGGWVTMDVDATAPITGSVNESVEGWTYGLGLERRFGPHWSGFIEWRHDEMDQTRFSFPADGYDEGITPDTDTARIGLNWRFAAAAAPPPPTPPPPPAHTPPPPPPQAAAVCPASEFVVYFEWDRSNLNQAATEVIDQAVTRARQCNISGIVVVGHTDTSGSTAYNQGLSERRAGVVRDALVARGMEAGAITTQAHGESDLARQTRDGVREPLNRRTAVTISFH